MWSVRAVSDHERDMLSRRSLPLLAALPVAVLALAGCGGNSSHALPTTSSGRPASVGVASTGLGDVLVDRQGRTVYLFERDSGTMSACTGTCAVNWPPLRVRGTPNVAVGASPYATYACVDTWLTDFRDDLSKIDVPVLVMHGSEDRILPFDSTAPRLPALIADCTLVPVEGGPHNIGWTFPDEVNGALLEFIATKAMVTA
jgi:predicted lipoprotein with Yx(FWY)xxD motif